VITTLVEPTGAENEPGLGEMDNAAGEATVVLMATVLDVPPALHTMLRFFAPGAAELKTKPYTQEAFAAMVPVHVVSAATGSAVRSAPLGMQVNPVTTVLAVIATEIGTF
jgi:hypothetical protein